MPTYQVHVSNCHLNLLMVLNVSNRKLGSTNIERCIFKKCGWRCSDVCVYILGEIVLKTKTFEIR